MLYFIVSCVMSSACDDDFEIPFSPALLRKNMHTIGTKKHR